MPTRFKRLACSSFVLVLACAHSDSVFAATSLLDALVGGGVPWSGPMNQIATWVAGPFVRYSLTVLLVILAVGFAVAEEHMSKWLGKGTKWLVGGAIAASVSWGLSLVGVSTSGVLLP